MDIAFTVHLPVDTDSVPFIRGLCRQALEHLRIERPVVDEITLALGRHRVTLEKRLAPHPPLRLVDPA